MIDSPEHLHDRKMKNIHRKPHERRRGMPSERSIRESWGKTSIWILKGYDSHFEFMGCPEYDPKSRKEVADRYCMACGQVAALDRCHITPICDGGSNEWWNLHLLCSVCHSDSEILGMTEIDSSHEKYWKWFFGRTMVDAWLSAAFRAGVNPLDILMPRQEASAI